MNQRAKLIKHNRRFGMLTVICRDGNIGKAAAWRCRCVCGNEVRVRASNLRSGWAKSCGKGHYNRALIYYVATDELHIWRGMLGRCHNPKNAAFKSYGAKGVCVCERWQHFENFLSDMGPRPSSEHSIDRYPDPHGNYELSNCRWATKIEQARNKRNTVFVEIDGQRIALVEHLAKLKVDRRMVYKRLRRGWSLEQAISVPSRRRLVDLELMKIGLVNIDPDWRDPLTWDLL